MSKETWGRVISIVLMAGIALAAVFGYDIVIVQPLAEHVAPNIADLNGAPARGVAGAAGDTNLTNVVTTGDMTVGGDLTVAGGCVGCGSVINTLDDIPNLSASRPITATAIVLGTLEPSGHKAAITPYRYGVEFNVEDSPGFVIGIDPEFGKPYIGYDAIGLNGTQIGFDDDNQKLTLTGVGGIELQAFNEGVSITGVFRSTQPTKQVYESSVSLSVDDNSALVFKSLYGGSSLAVSLPSYVNGLNYCFLVRTGQSMTIDPYSTLNIIDTLTDSYGDKISNSTAGSSICLVAYAGQWLPYALTGTWTDAN